jgi:hypothetical protein
MVTIKSRESNGKLDHMSCKMAHKKGATQFPSKSHLQEEQQNSGKCVEEYGCDFQVVTLMDKLAKCMIDILQRNSNLINIDICNLGSKCKGILMFVSGSF